MLLERVMRLFEDRSSSTLPNTALQFSTRSVALYVARYPNSVPVPQFRTRSVALYVARYPKSGNSGDRRESHSGNRRGIAEIIIGAYRRSHQLLQAPGSSIRAHQYRRCRRSGVGE
eukprot:473905-Rhodomonas_salina.1